MIEVHNLIPFLPDPKDKHPAPLRPSVVKEGEYTLRREPLDTEVKIEEPDGSTYLVEFFECDVFIKRFLRIDEVEANKILDTLWNFGCAKFNPLRPEIVKIR